MIDTLPGGTKAPEPPPAATPAPPARAGNDTATGDTAPMRKSRATGQDEGRFFRGLAIMAGISVLFWALVVTLFHIL
jgi:hypothetical protein